MANHGAAYLLLMASLIVAVALSGADARLTVHPDANGGDHHADAAVQKVEPTCSDSDPKPQPTPEPEPEPAPEPEPPCSNCEAPKPPCSNCEAPKPALTTCNKMHGVQASETCESIAQCAGLTQDQFLGFNPNIECCKLFTGQWVCLEATPTCAS